MHLVWHELEVNFLLSSLIMKIVIFDFSERNIKIKVICNFDVSSLFLIH